MQLVQILGAVAVLAAYVLAQLGRLDPTSGRYLVLNAAGSGVLAIVALQDHQWGFVLLEGVWSLVSTWGLASLVLRRPQVAPAPETTR